MRKPLMSVEVFARIKAKDADGNEHVREFGINPDVSWFQIFEAAHQNADGSLPTVAQCNGNANLWSDAIGLRRVKDELHALCATTAAEPSFIPWPTDQPPRYNTCTDPCDMWTGPCACGAWHKDGK